MPLIDKLLNRLLKLNQHKKREAGKLPKLIPYKKITMCKLTKIFQDYKKDGTLADTMEIDIEYDPETQTIEDVIQIKVFDRRYGMGQDITDLFTSAKSGLKNYTDDLIDSIDWYAIYREQGTKRTFHNNGQVFKDNMAVCEAMNDLNKPYDLFEDIAKISKLHAKVTYGIDI